MVISYNFIYVFVCVLHYYCDNIHVIKGSKLIRNITSPITEASYTLVVIPTVLGWIEWISRLLAGCLYFRQEQSLLPVDGNFMISIFYLYNLFETRFKFYFILFIIFIVIILYFIFITIITMFLQVFWYCIVLLLFFFFFFLVGGDIFQILSSLMEKLYQFYPANSWMCEHEGKLYTFGVRW